MDLQSVILIAGNSLFLMTVLILTIRLGAVSVHHNKEIGNDAVQIPLRVTIMKLITALFFLALAAAVFNIFLT